MSNVGSLEWNSATWSKSSWSTGGDEWSKSWGDSHLLWERTIFPRLRPFLPNGTVLELAPGFGRVTQFVEPLAERLLLVDLVDKCIDACRKRFADKQHIEYFVNDGRSLAMIEPGSVDFVLSWDSLVHADRVTLLGYAGELARVLKPGGLGFIHHSNFGASYAAGVPNPHNRSTDVTAEHFAEECRRVGMSCLTQEKLCWGSTTKTLTDCFSTFCNRAEASRGPRVVENYDFMQEARNSLKIYKLYARPER